MSLKLFLTLEQTSLLYQQDTSCHVTLTNQGSAPITLKLSKMDARQPAVRLVNVTTGTEEIYRRELEGDVNFAEPLQLSPGQSLEESFMLFEITGQLPAGEYAMSVLWEYNEESARAESNSVSVSIAASVPANLNTVDAVGGRSGYKYGTWVDKGGKSPAVYYAGFSLEPGGGIGDMVKISPARGNASPFLSAPAPGMPMQSHWLAWLDGNILFSTHIDANLEVIPARKIELPGGSWEIIPPLYSYQDSVAGNHSRGGILLGGTEKNGKSFKLQSVQLSEGQMRLAANAVLPGAKPLWLMNLPRGEAEPSLIYLQSDEKKLSLYLHSWPGVKSPGPSPVCLASFDSGFLVGATAKADQSGYVHGALLSQDKKDLARIEILSWALSQDNHFQMGERKYLSWPAELKISKSHVAVSESGQAVLTITAENGNVYGYDGNGNLHIMDGGITSDLLAHAIGFVGDAPILILASENIGFHILTFDGSPLEMPSSPKGEEGEKGESAYK